MSPGPARAPLAPPPLSFPVKLTYGLGSVANGVVAAALAGAVLQLYFNQVVGVPAVLVGAAIMASLLADVVLFFHKPLFSSAYLFPWDFRGVQLPPITFLADQLRRRLLDDRACLHLRHRALGREDLAFERRQRDRVEEGLELAYGLAVEPLDRIEQIAV